MMYRKYSVFVLLVLAVACDSGEVALDVAAKGDYFPLSDNIRWNYQVKTDCNCDCPCAGSADMMEDVLTYQYSYRTGEDTVLENKMYTKILEPEENTVVRLVRREGSKYYTRNVWNNNESVFLDTSVPVGNSWIQYENHGHFSEVRIVNMVMSVNRSMTINGKSYRNVMCVQEAITHSEVSSGYCSRYIVYHYYAEGVGEIYSHRPYNPVTYYSGDTNIILSSVFGI